jgi:hypothetical protein
VPFPVVVGVRAFGVFRTYRFLRSWDVYFRRYWRGCYFLDCGVFECNHLAIADVAEYAPSDRWSEGAFAFWGCNPMSRKCGETWGTLKRQVPFGKLRAGSQRAWHPVRNDNPGESGA